MKYWYVWYKENGSNTYKSCKHKDEFSAIACHDFMLACDSYHGVMLREGIDE